MHGAPPCCPLVPTLAGQRMIQGAHAYMEQHVTSSRLPPMQLWPSSAHCRSGQHPTADSWRPRLSYPPTTSVSARHTRHMPRLELACGRIYGMQLRLLPDVRMSCHAMPLRYLTAATGARLSMGQHTAASLKRRCSTDFCNTLPHVLHNGCAEQTASECAWLCAFCHIWGASKQALLGASSISQHGCMPRGVCGRNTAAVQTSVPAPCMERLGCIQLHSTHSQMTQTT